jgi:parvulin-like peptidyl-prolyl isomerase
MRRFLPFLILVGIAACGDTGDTVATFDTGTVSAGAFRLRYAKFLESTGQRDNILLRKEILNNMINEELMLADLAAKGFSDRPDVKEKREQIRLQAILDRYSRKISTDTLTISEEEFRKEFLAYNTTASVRYLYADSEEGAWVLKKKLEHGASFEELAPGVFEDPGLATNGGYIGSFGWGEMEPALEEKAFFLPPGKISDPFPMKIGYGILRVENRVIQPLRTEFDYAKAKPALGKAILQRKTLQCLKDVTDRIARDASPVFEETTVSKVLEHWEVLLTTGRLEEKNRPDLSGRHLVTFRDGSWTVGDFLVRVERTSERQRKRVHSHQDVKDVITGLIVREEMLRLAIADGLGSDASVREQISSVYHHYQLMEWRKMVIDTIGRSGWSEEVLRREFDMNTELHRKPPEVNVAEILVRTKEEAVALAEQLRNGADFSRLAENHSIRVWAGKQGGELGFGTKASFGVLGEKFFEAPVGSLIGPEFVDPYYGIFRIIERREGQDAAFEDAREEVIARLTAQREREVFADAVRSLRSEARIEIDETALATVVVENQVKDDAS